jgi:hypothetical protein
LGRLSETTTAMVKGDIRFITWKVRSHNKSGSMKTAAKEPAK